jgi:hypothetical protein
MPTVRSSGLGAASPRGPVPRPSGPRPARPGVVAQAVAVVAVLAVLVLAVTACGSKSSARPTTPATLQILTPTAHAVTGSTFDLRMALAHARVISPSQAKGIDPAQGYIHVSVDGKLVGITYSLDEVVSHLTPGAHTLEAAFVASDHRPFANQVVATVSFTVQ